MVATQFNAKIKVFKFDNALELAFADFFNDRGVLHQFSCVKIPQHNSIVEIKHQHLLNVARALYVKSDGINANNAQPDFIPSCENLIGINLIE